MLFSRFHTDHVLCSIRLSGYQIGGPQIHILDRGRKYDMYRFIISDSSPCGAIILLKPILRLSPSKKSPLLNCALAAVTPVIRAKNIIRIFFISDCILIGWLIIGFLLLLLCLTVRENEVTACVRLSE